MAAAGLFTIVLFGLFASAGHTYETGVGERRTVILADGSRVSLDTNSRITVRYTRQARLIDLNRGQALFDVVHQTSRILRVKAGETLIQDLGTRFDVRREDGHVRVTVVEGSVKVDAIAGKGARTLVAGQQILTGGDTSAPPYSVDPIKATSWTGGRLIFEDMRLVDATSEMNRYGRHPLVLNAGPLDDLKVNGTFESADTQAFVAAVTQLYGLKADPQSDGSILLTGAPDASR